MVGWVVPGLLFFVALLVSFLPGAFAVNLPLSEPVYGYALTNAFPGITFRQPVVITSVPGDTNRLFIAEKRGRIMALNDLTRPSPSVFLDLTTNTYSSVEAGLLGLAFHPNFSRNGKFYIYRVVLDGGFKDQLSEFRCDPPDSLVADPASEVVLISQPDVSDTHNAGDLKFGPDGYLYLSLGDEGPVFPDTSEHPQAIDKGFFGGIIRIDVDNRPENLPPAAHAAIKGNYRIPRDNPFIGATSFNGVAIDPGKVRTEFFAVGLRNPWRFTFHPFTGQIICADVGSGTIEEINLIHKGGNYGWPYMEGLIQALPNVPPALEPPFYFYQHGVGPFSGRVVIGGVVYTAADFPELHSMYLFADYESGNIWALDTTVPGSQPIWLTERSDISTFGIHPADGSVLVGNHLTGRIERLIYGNPDDSRIPRSLRETGAFEDLASLRTVSNMIPFEVISPLWSDGAYKQRWIDPAIALGKIEFKPSAGYSFPEGMVWVKHFELEMTNGLPQSRRRLETRFIVKTHDDVYGLTYRWDAAQTNAYLVPPQGTNESFLIHDHGLVRTQVWNYPSWNQCRTCHNKESGYILGFTTDQLNRSVSRRTETNQLQWLANKGIFDNPLAIHPAELPRLSALDDPIAPLQHRVRSYLESNCVQCHRPDGRSGAAWDARISMPLASAGILNHTPVFYPPPLRIIDPGNLTNSYMFSRVDTRIPQFQMPPLATTERDRTFLDALAAWIVRMPREGWTNADFGLALAEGAAEFNGGTVRVSSAGAGVASDSFYFIGREAYGNSELSARLNSIESSSKQAEAGLMIRQQMSHESGYAALIQKANQLLLVLKPDPMSNVQTVSTVAATSGSRLKLVCADGFVSAWAQTANAAWLLVGRAEFAVGSNYYAGFAVASCANEALFASANLDEVNLSSIQLNPPVSNDITLPAAVPLSVQVSTYGDALQHVAFRNQDTELGRVSSAPWNLAWTNPAEGIAVVSAVAGGPGLSLTSAPVTIQLRAPAAQVWLNDPDARTLGNWSQRYGNESIFIPGVTNTTGSIVQLDLLQGAPQVIGEVTNRSGLRVLGTRIASQLTHSESVGIALSARDYTVHQAALYFRDWSGFGKTQTVSFFDARGEELLARTQIVAESGVYLPFVFRDRIIVRVENPSGPAYLTGLFMDPVWPLTVELSSPQDGAILQQPATVELNMVAEAPGREVARLELWDGGEQFLSFETPPSQLYLTNLFPGDHEIKAVAYGTFGISGASDAVAFTVLPAPAAAEFLRIDRTTRGTWKGLYGSDAFWLAGAPPRLPSTIQAALSKDSIFVFADPTDDTGALQRPGANDRYAACFHGQEFTVDLNVRDGQPRTAAFYVLDWGNSQREMEIRVERADDGEVLDRRTVNGFDQGQYYVWRVQGALRFRFTSKAINAVLSGLFIDPIFRPYETWLRTQFSGEELQAGLDLIGTLDADQDGISNALEYYLGSNPRSAEDKSSLKISASPGWLQITLSQRAVPPDMALSFEQSADLIGWRPANPVAITQQSTEGSRIAYNFPAPPGGEPQFVRFLLRPR